jgi:hypothetical protein
MKNKKRTLLRIKMISLMMPATSLQKGNQVMTAHVKRGKLDDFGNAIGTADPDPILNTQLHVPKFPDGVEAEHSANAIAENMWTQCNIEGNRCQLLEALIDHEPDEHAIQCADGCISINGQKHVRTSTKGWQLCIQWKDDSTSWGRLADVKGSDPIKVA